jgi:3-hydroxypropanoate dehydrogenase
VSDSELSEIWELAKWAPTAANSQPLRVLYVRPGEGRDRLVKHMSDGNRDKTESAPAVAILAVDARFHEHIPAILPFKPELKDVFAANDELRDTTATFNATLQAAYFILAVRALGLAAGPMAGFDSAASTRTSSPTAATTRSWSSTSVIPARTPGSGGCHACTIATWCSGSS